MKNLTTNPGKNKYAILSELGSEFKLSFSSHLLLNNRIIALDGIKKSLLVLETNTGFNRAYVIELSRVATISVKKSYGSIQSGQLKNKDMDDFLKRIDLLFEFADENETIAVNFYESETDDPIHLSKLERNAVNWQMILSRILGHKPGEIQDKKTGHLHKDRILE